MNAKVLFQRFIEFVHKNCKFFYERDLTRFRDD